MHLAQYVYSKLFQQQEFQSLCYDVLFQCRFLFALFCEFQAIFNINYLKFLMFYSMVDKCLMTQAGAAVFNILATGKYTLSLLTLPPR